MDFVPGALVAGRYRLRRMVGAGGMGEVWAGEDAKTGAKVAVKHLLPAAAKHHEVVARFKREAYLLGRVESDYIARVIDFFDDETYGLVLVMEYIEGPSLAHILEQRTLSVEEAIDLAVDLLRALKDLHASKIVHRDLKPGNIIMRPGPGGTQLATVVDFGISRLLPGKGENEVTGITRANIALGTVEYMAPEQILNSRDVTPVTDLYAVGIILFRSVKGHHAFGDRRGEELARAKLIEEAPGLETGRRDDVANGLTTLVARALKKKPSHRYPSAEQMLSEVEELQKRVQRNIDLDEATTDSGDTVDTAVKPSPLASQPGTREPPIVELPPARPGAGVGLGLSPSSPAAKVELRAAAMVERSVAPSPARPPATSQPPRAPLPSIPEVPSVPSPVQPAAARLSGDWGIAGSDGGRASLPSLPGPISDRDVPPIPRAPLPSIPENGSPGSLGASTLPQVTSQPPRSELTMERGGMSRGTIALAILTAFAVGAAVGLIVAPTNAPAGKTSDTCVPSASAAAAANPTTAKPGTDLTSLPNAAATSTATVTAASGAALVSASAKSSSSAKASASASTSASATAKASASAAKTSDGLGEDEPPKKKPKPPPPPQSPPPQPVYPLPQPTSTGPAFPDGL